LQILLGPSDTRQSQLVLCLLRYDGARMNHVQQDHGREHQCGIENIQPVLRTLQGPIDTLYVFDRTEDGSDEDEGRDGV